jgi:vacuolar-type H+-ATPase subunit B/Vma2
MARGLLTVTYRTVGAVAGPLLFVRLTRGVALDELAAIALPDGRSRLGQVLEVRDDLAIVQVFAGTEGIDAEHTAVRFLGETARVGVSLEMLGRSFDGLGRPSDGGPAVLPEAYLDVNGLPLNPAARECPADFIETGISAWCAARSSRSSVRSGSRATSWRRRSLPKRGWAQASRSPSSSPRSASRTARRLTSAPPSRPRGRWDGPFSS